MCIRDRRPTITRTPATRRLRWLHSETLRPVSVQVQAQIVPQRSRNFGLDQRRFDALVTICAAALGRPDAPAGRAGVRPTVYLYADVATWAGLAEHPVELDGYGVIPAGAAREHFTDARWRASVTDAAGAVT